MKVLSISFCLIFPIPAFFGVFAQAAEIKPPAHGQTVTEAFAPRKSWAPSNERIKLRLAGDVFVSIGLKETPESRKRFGVRDWQKKEQVFIPSRRHGPMNSVELTRTTSHHSHLPYKHEMKSDECQNCQDPNTDSAYPPAGTFWRAFRRRYSEARSTRKAQHHFHPR